MLSLNRGNGITKVDVFQINTVIVESLELDEPISQLNSSAYSKDIYLFRIAKNQQIIHCKLLKNEVHLK